MSPSLATAQVLHYATGTDARTLDPQYVTDIPTARVVTQIHETLVGRDKAGAIKGVLAESWDVSEDGKVWTFHLRKGLEFHDGTPFNAAAVKFSYDRIRAEKTAAPRASIMLPIAAVDVVDDYTINVTTHERFAPLLSQLSAYPLSIISPKAGEALNADYSKAPAGTGPFKLESWSPGERINLVANKAYWGDAPKIEGVEFLVVPEDSTRLLKLMAGEADIISNISPMMLDSLSNSPEIKVLNETGIRTIYAGFNVKMKPFDDIRVRQAIAHAIDTKSILHGVMNNVGSLGGSLESPILPLAPTIPPYEFNPQRAKELLAEAGYANGLKLDFYVPTGRYINDRQVGEAIQAQLREVGVDVTLHSPEWGAYISMLDAGNKAGFFLLGKGSPTGDLDYTLGTNLSREGTSNYHAYASDKIEELLVKQREAIDEGKRAELLKEILTTAYDDVPLIVLFYENQVFATRSAVKDFAVLPNEMLVFSTVSVD